MSHSLLRSNTSLAACVSTLSVFASLTSCSLDATRAPEPGEGGGTAGSGGNGGQSGRGGSGGTGGIGNGGSGGGSGGAASAGGRAGGSSGSGGTGALAGSAGSSGSNPASGGSAGSNLGGAGATNGGGGAGGRGGGAGSGSSGAGAGGVPSGAGTGGSAGAGGAATQPSAGCGKPPPSPGSAQSPLTIANHQYYVIPPTGYDNTKPYRVIFGMHPSGNPIGWAEQNMGFDKTDAKTQAIMVYPKSAGNGWERVDIDLFDPLYGQIVANYCVDLARVFATGESSGGDYASILGCEKADKVRAVGPTAAKPMSGVGLDPDRRTCNGQSAAYVIHGKMDSVVGAQAGIDTRDFHLAKNNCGTMTTPVMGYTDTLSNCVFYQGCDEGYPVYWCQHTDPEYSNTNHGWPKFAGRFLWEQFAEY